MLRVEVGDEGGVEVEVEEEEERHKDWILATHTTPSHLYLLTAHNKVLVRKREGKGRMRRREEEEVEEDEEEVGEVVATAGPCILYSGALVPTSDGAPVVVGGTVVGLVQVGYNTQFHHTAGVAPPDRGPPAPPAGPRRGHTGPRLLLLHLLHSLHLG